MLAPVDGPLDSPEYSGGGEVGSRSGGNSCDTDSPCCVVASGGTQGGAPEPEDSREWRPGGRGSCFSAVGTACRP